MRHRKIAFFLLAAVLLSACAGAPSGSAAGAVNITYDPEFQYMELDTGITMAYVELGKAEGDPVVLIHGVTDSFISFSQVAPRIAAAGYRVIVPELRGHGHTDKPEEGPYTIDMHAADINALLTGLDITAAHITGHSLGSLIAQGMAIQYPDKVSSLTLIASSGKVEGNATLAWSLEGDEEFVGINHMTELPDDFLVDWTSSNNYDPEFVRRTYENAKQMPLYAWVNAFNGIANDPEGLADITVPVQIIYGTEDDFFTMDEQLELIERLGSDYILFLPKHGYGHNTQWEQHMGEEVSADILGFLTAIH